MTDLNADIFANISKFLEEIQQQESLSTLRAQSSNLAAFRLAPAAQESPWRGCTNTDTNQTGTQVQVAQDLEGLAIGGQINQQESASLAAFNNRSSLHSTEDEEEDSSNKTEVDSKIGVDSHNLDTLFAEPATTPTEERIHISNIPQLVQTAHHVSKSAAWRPILRKSWMSETTSSLRMRLATVRPTVH